MTSRCTTVLIGSLLSAGAAFAVELDWYAVAGGGAYSAGGAFELAGTIGQPDAGSISGATFTLTGGYWAAPAGAPPLTGDCDADGDLDLIDYGDVASCLNGPAALSPSGCACADFDGDGDVDLADFAGLQRAFAE